MDDIEWVTIKNQKMECNKLFGFSYVFVCVQCSFGFGICSCWLGLSGT